MAAVTPEASSRTDGRTVPRTTERLIMVILALVIATLAGAGAALYQHTRKAVYLSIATLTIDQPAQIALSNDDGTLTKLQTLRFQYAGLLNTDVIGNPVSRQLHLPAAVVEASLLGAPQPTNFNLPVEARAGSASQAQLLAQSAAAQLISYVSKHQRQAGISPAARVELLEVVSPSLGRAVEPSRERQEVAGVVAFAVVGLGFAIVADLLRRRR